MAQFKVSYSYTVLEYGEAIIEADDAEEAQEAFLEDSCEDNIEVYDTRELND